MTRRVVGSTCAAALLSIGVVAAQVQSQQPTQSPVQGDSQQQTPAERGQTPLPGPTSPTTASASKDITVTGCVMREGTSDYVLSSAATPGGSANVAGGVSGSTSGGAIGTSGSTSTKANRYMLSSTDNLSTYVGQRVEVMGHVDTTAGAVGTSGTTSTGAGINASAGASDRDSAAGISGATKAETPQHFIVSSVKATTGSCP